MLELKNTKIMAVDHGYGNMKTANTVTPTGTKAYKTQVDSKDLLWLIAFTDALWLHRILPGPYRCVPCTPWLLPVSCGVPSALQSLSFLP